MPPDAKLLPEHAVQVWSVEVVHVSVVQLGIVVHVEQERSAVAVQAALWYEPALPAPALHAPEQV